MNIPNKKRLQLTLFVNSKDAEIIEEIRKTYNPIQFQIIPAHVTLCREDEVFMLERVLDNLSRIKQSSLTIHFGKPTLFFENKGVLLPAIGDFNHYLALRKLALRDVFENPKSPEPHITLMHPRNSTCNDRIFDAIEKISFPTQLTFDKVSLIEQELDKQWKILQEFDLT